MSFTAYVDYVMVLLERSLIKEELAEHVILRDKLNFNFECEIMYGKCSSGIMILVYGVDVDQPES